MCCYPSYSVLCFCSWSGCMCTLVPLLARLSSPPTLLPVVAATAQALATILPLLDLNISLEMKPTAEPSWSSVVSTSSCIQQRYTLTLQGGLHFLPSVWTRKLRLQLSGLVISPFASLSCSSWPVNSRPRCCSCPDEIKTGRAIFIRVSRWVPHPGSWLKLDTAVPQCLSPSCGPLLHWPA